MPESDLITSLMLVNLVAMFAQFYGFLTYCIVAILLKYAVIDTVMSWPFDLYDISINVLNLLQIWMIFTLKAGGDNEFKSVRYRAFVVRYPYPHWSANLPKEAE